MTSTAAWVMAFFLALCVIGLIAHARGHEHYRGDEVGSHGTKVIVVAPQQ